MSDPLGTETPMTTTAGAAIIAAAQAYNAQYEGAAAEIATATPVIDVTYETTADGRRVTVTVVPAVVFPDGGVAFAADPALFGPIRVFDGRDIIGTVGWAAKKAYKIPAGVAVAYRRPRLPENDLGNCEQAR